MYDNVLAYAFSDLALKPPGLGAQLLDQNLIVSKTLICFIDRQGNVHAGFAYRNGSNVRVVCWEYNPWVNGKRVNHTFPAWNQVIAFPAACTRKPFNHGFLDQDFLAVSWWIDNATAVIENHMAQYYWQQLDGITKQMGGLGI